MPEREDIILDVSFRKKQIAQPSPEIQDSILESQYIPDFDQVLHVSHRSEDGKIYALNPVREHLTQNSTYISKVSMYEVGIFKRAQPPKKPKFTTPIIYDK